MTRFLFIRHGQSLANSKGVYAGQLDYPLTELGRAQAKAAAKYIKENFKPVVVIASDLSRARDTGLEVAKACGVPLVENKAFRELDVGKWEGLEYAVAQERFADNFKIWVEDIGNYKAPDGESTRDVFKRVGEALEKLAEEYPNCTVAVACHATPVIVFQALCMGYGPDRIRDLNWAPNASVTVGDYENGKFSKVEFGINSYLEGEFFIPAESF
jgi:probable phosphoglycerate mutase